MRNISGVLYANLSDNGRGGRMRAGRESGQDKVGR